MNLILPVDCLPLFLHLVRLKLVSSVLNNIATGR